MHLVYPGRFGFLVVFACQVSITCYPFVAHPRATDLVLLMSIVPRQLYPKDRAISIWKKGTARWKSGGVAQFDAPKESVVCLLSIVVEDASFDGLLLMALSCVAALA